MPSPMPSMLTTLTEKIDTSPSARRADEHGQRGEHAAEGDEQRHAGGDEPAEQHDHHDDRDRAGRSPRRAAGRSPTPSANVSLTSTLPPTSTSGASSSWARSSTSCATRQLGVVVEVAGQRDDHERGSTVGRAERVGAGRPRVGDVDHAVERGDRREPGGDASRWTCGSSTSMPSAMMAICPPVSARSSSCCGDPARLGGRAGTEVGRQHREGRAADGGGDDRGARSRPG